MYEFFQSLVIGAVQGVTEFLPISSSAHLVLVPWLLGWPYAGLTFDVALHVGSLFSILAYFWRDWHVLISNAIKRKDSFETRLFWFLVLSTIPGVIAGFLFEEHAETIFRSPVLIGSMLIIMGIILYIVDLYSVRAKSLQKMTLGASLVIGLSQAFAIVPGVSRSGVTMTMGRALGFSREAAARFSFLMATPIIVGAGIYRLHDLTPGDIDLSFATGVISSAVMGFLAIGFLMRYLSKKSFAVFAVYRIIVGLTVIIIALTRG